jgi:hypothetical protein
LDIDENGLFHLKVNRNTFRPYIVYVGIYTRTETDGLGEFGWTSSHYGFWGILWDTSSTELLTMKVYMLMWITSYVIDLRG